RFGEDGPAKENCDPASGSCTISSELGVTVADASYMQGKYKPWYSSRFADVVDVAKYWNEHYSDLRAQSQLFSQTFFASTLPPEVLEAAAANLTILKSPTVMRQYDGRLWNFVGCGD